MRDGLTKLLGSLLGRSAGNVLHLASLHPNLNYLHIAVSKMDI
jgi:hypothetical protein